MEKGKAADEKAGGAKKVKNPLDEVYPGTKVKKKASQVEGMEGNNIIEVSLIGAPKNEDNLNIPDDNNDNIIINSVASTNANSADVLICVCVFCLSGGAIPRLLLVLCCACAPSVDVLF